jgi:flavodoxin
MYQERKERIFIMKKFASLLLGVSMVIGLTACGNSSSSSTATSTSESVAQTVEQTSVETTTEKTTTEEATTEEATTEETATEQTTSVETQVQEAVASTETGKTLVVYFSASGNTEKVANYIAAATDADMFELIPQEPYTDDDLNWSDSSSRVVYEHDNLEARDVKLANTSVPNWDTYDTVYIGYPIWWQIAAWPVDDFVKSNDFTGKTVIPFCTSSSSGLGESGTLLADEAGTGNWLEGQRFSSSASESTVQDWVNSLE